MNSFTGMNDLLPSEFHLSQNYPNPFNETTTVKFCVAYKTTVKLEILSSEGNMIRTIVNEEKEAGTYEIEVDASTLPAGGPGPSEGIYVYHLEAGEFSATKKMTFFRWKQSI